MNLFNFSTIFKTPNFTRICLFDSTKLEVCEDISYLGITLNYNGSFIKAKNKLVQKAQKTLYSVKRKVRNLCIPVPNVGHCLRYYRDNIIHVMFGGVMH
jgi:hypothetical protein